jgi:mono/diheme cytochrome c family protein
VKSIPLRILTLALPLAWVFGGASAAAQGAAAPADGVSSVARAIKESNKTYLGWRLYQDRCARCHGKDASGSAQAPSLLERLKPLDEKRFADVVLNRYGWAMSGSDAQGESGARDQLLQAILERKEGAVRMPAWESEPEVSAHLDDLYQFLKARSEGRLGSGRPAWSAK